MIFAFAKIAIVPRVRVLHLQVGFKSQLIVGPGQRGKENNPYFHIAAEHLSSVATHLASPATKASSNFSTRSRKPLYGNNAPEARV